MLAGRWPRREGPYSVTKRRGAERRGSKEAGGAALAAIGSPPPKADSLPDSAITRRIPDWAWLAVGALAILALLWSCRGAPLGTPVADDYTFLASLRFQSPVDLLGPMGSPYYWRPLSRQLYFMALGPWLVRAPWVAALFHAALLIALFVVLFRIARRFTPPPVAAAIAVFPLLGEPTRVLLAWPSGAEYLLGMLGAAIAVDQALAGRLLPAALAATAAILSHEAATFVLPVLPAIAWFRTRRLRSVFAWMGVAGAIGVISFIGHSAAHARGMSLPSSEPLAWIAWPECVSRAVLAQLNIEDATAARRRLFLWAALALLAIAGLLGLRRSVRARIVSRGPALVGSLAWFAIGLLPLTVLLPEWNGWRTVFPALGLGFAMTGLLGLAAPGLAAGLVALRLIALLLVPAAPRVVAMEPPETRSELSFPRLARMQRIVESTRRALTARFPRLPRGGSVFYLGIPHQARVGFEDSLAVRVWYGEPTLHWGMFGRQSGVFAPVDAMVEFVDGAAWPAVAVEPDAVRLFQEAGVAMDQGELRDADSLLARAAAVQPMRRATLLSMITVNRAIVAYGLRDYHRADSLNQVAFRLGGEEHDCWALAACLALTRNDREAAREATRRCLEIDPQHPEGRKLAMELQVGR